MNQSDDRADATDQTLTGGRRNVTPAMLDDVFDDPAHGDPGRDRMAVHVVWELVLLAGTVVVAALLYRTAPDRLHGDALRGLMVYIAALGLLTMGAGLSLRAGAVNLAIGPVAVAAAVLFADKGGDGVVPVAVTATIAAVIIGVAIGVLVVGFHVPGWAASLAAALAVAVWIRQHQGPIAVSGEYDPTRHATYLVGGFVAIAVLGGLFGSIKAVRRAVGRFRPVSDPARRRGGLAGTLTAGSLVLSTVFAAGAGILLAAGSTEPVVPTAGFELTGLGVGAALLGGTSAFGRRGGVFGTVLAVGLLALFLRYQDARGWNISTFAIAAAALAMGLMVTRMVETFGRPRSARDSDEWADGDESGSWSTARPDSWSSVLPAQPTADHGSLWEDDSWRGGTR